MFLFSLVACLQAQRSYSATVEVVPLDLSPCDAARPSTLCRLLQEARGPVASPSGPRLGLMFSCPEVLTQVGVLAVLRGDDVRTVDGGALRDLHHDVVSCIDYGCSDLDGSLALAATREAGSTTGRAWRATVDGSAAFVVVEPGATGCASVSVFPDVPIRGVTGSASRR